MHPDKARRFAGPVVNEHAINKLNGMTARLSAVVGADPSRYFIHDEGIQP